jgi:tricarballylate dehydrogenase
MPDITAPEELSGTFDLVVIGHGFGGLTSALAYAQSVRDAGRTPRIAVLEKSSYDDRGGSTRWTGAYLSLTPERTLRPFWGERVRETAGVLANEEYIDAFYRLVPETLDWLDQNGITVNHFNPTTLEAGAWCVDGGGKAVVDGLPPLIAALGGKFFYDTTARRLVTSDDGRVAGVEVVDANGRTRVVEAGAVVLANGGFEGNHEWLTRYIPNAYKLRTVSPGTSGNKGDGIRMAVDIGADTAGQFDGAHVEPCDPRIDDIEPLVMTWRWGILVNQQGERFMDESGDLGEIQFDLVGNVILREQDNFAWTINDSAQRRNVPGFDFQNPRAVEPIVADTIEELAEKLGIEPARLRDTVDRFNAAIEVDPPSYNPSASFDGYGTKGLTPPKSNSATRLLEAPFYAWPTHGRICFTYGGLRVDGDAHVLDTTGKPIPGLYAAGEIAGIFYANYPAGTSGLRSMTFGRRAGIVSAAETAYVAAVGV